MGYTWAFTVAARLLFVKFDRSDQSKEEIDSILRELDLIIRILR